MNEREVAEIRRRFRPDRNSFTNIRGCYVNEMGSMVAQFHQSLTTMSQEESELLLGVLRKALSGGLGKHLRNLSFETSQVAYGEEHKLLMALRDSELKDDPAVEEFFQKVISSVEIEGSYLILLVHDRYDVPYRSKNDERMDDAGDQVFRYVLCAVCPINDTKPALSYYARENEFHNRSMDQLVAPPVLGFLFPAFDERATNLYGALCYTKDPAKEHRAFLDAVFKLEPPMPAAAQMENFQFVLSEALEDEGSYEVVQAVHSQLREMIAIHKENKEREPLELSQSQLTGVLRSCGVSQEQAEVFDRQFEETFGADAMVSPTNLMDFKQMNLTTPNVTVRVNPERGDLVQTRISDGQKYILIRVEEGVEVNGVAIQIDE